MISCVCPTYGRPRLLEEAIHSFLIQDYIGAKELIILNDCPEQILKYRHPDVHVINCPKRFYSLGEKRNATVGLCSGGDESVIFPWDDDDISMPNRITLSLSLMNGKSFFKPTKCFVLDSNNGEYLLSGPVASVFHASSCWTKDWFWRVRGYRPITNGEDQLIEKEARRASENMPLNILDIEDKDNFYIYRWGGTESFHASWYEKERDAIKESENFVKASSAFKTGEIELHPHWKIDYIELKKKYIESISTNIQSCSKHLRPPARHSGRP